MFGLKIVAFLELSQLILERRYFGITDADLVGLSPSMRTSPIGAHINTVSAQYKYKLHIQTQVQIQIQIQGRVESQHEDKSHLCSHKYSECALLRNTNTIWNITNTYYEKYIVESNHVLK